MSVVCADRIPGNGRTAVWVTSRRGIALDRCEVDVLTGETRAPKFLALNPAGFRSSCPTTAARVEDGLDVRD